MASALKILNSVKKVFCVAIILGFSSCIASTEDHIRLLENYLESFIGKPMRNVINSFGTPTKYSNRADNLPGEQSGTYMIYDYRPRNNDCIITFKYAKTTLKIIDWDYEGNCLLLDGK